MLYEAHAKSCPPLENLISLHALIAIVLYGFKPFEKTFIIRTLSVKPTIKWNPDGWKATLYASSLNSSQISRVGGFELFQILTVLSIEHVAMRFFLMQISIPEIDL